MVKFKFSTYHIVEISFSYIGICVHANVCICILPFFNLSEITTTIIFNKLHNLYFKTFSGF